MSKNKKKNMWNILKLWKSKILYIFFKESWILSLESEKHIWQLRFFEIEL